MHLKRISILLEDCKVNGLFLFVVVLIPFYGDGVYHREAICNYLRERFGKDLVNLRDL